MFSSVGWGEVALLLVVGVVVLGPERLPGYVTDATRLLRRLRALSAELSGDLREQLGPELGALASTDLSTLRPQELLRRHLLDEPAAPLVPAPRSPVPEATQASEG